MNHERFPMQMTQDTNHNKWLEILTSEDSPPNLQYDSREIIAQ